MCYSALGMNSNSIVSLYVDYLEAIYWFGPVVKRRLSLMHYFAGEKLLYLFEFKPPSILSPTPNFSTCFCEEKNNKKYRHTIIYQVFTKIRK